MNLDFNHLKDPKTTSFCMGICMSYQVVMAIMSLSLIKAGGWAFFKDAKSIADIVMIIAFTTYFTLASELRKDGGLIEYHTVMTPTDSWMSCLLVVILLVMLYQLAKFCEIYHNMSLMKRMIYKCA